MPVSADAALGVIATFSLAAAGALWKLATMLAEVRGQVRHNGGSTLKDDARIAAREAVAAREAAEVAKNLAATVATDLSSFRGHQAEDTAAIRAVLGKVEHNVANVRASQVHLLDQQLALEQRVDNIAAERTRRDQAIGDALVESLDVALAVSDEEAA